MAWKSPWANLADAACRSLRHARGRPRWAVAVEDARGMIHVGISLSFSDLPAASLCAEQVALAGLRLHGYGEARRVVRIAGGAAAATPPCGRCLQLLIELGPLAVIAWGSVDGMLGSATVRQLLPNAFMDYRDSRSASSTSIRGPEPRSAPRPSRPRPSSPSSLATLTPASSKR
jgi:cytidine deaminase